ncbi:MAG: hypothetical protein ABSF64_20900 [Bryobacteraceae bacterium]|jgi:hypothetical protein
MLIQRAIKSIYTIPGCWVRAPRIRTIPGGLEICFAIHKGKRGKKVDDWIVACRGVHETKITDLDGGGLGVYGTSHPAAYQYVARQAELRRPRGSDELKVLATLFSAHRATVNDWIPFERYVFTDGPWDGRRFPLIFAPGVGDWFVCRGPDFLLRAYAKALESIGEPVRMTLRGRPKSKSLRPGVLHFGSSYVFANEFAARRPGELPLRAAQTPLGRGSY